MKKKKTFGECKKCGGLLDKLDLQYGCLRCKIIEDRTPRKLTGESLKAVKRWEKMFK